MNNEICRICKNTNITEFNSKNIFIDENLEIIEKLLLCANIQLEKEDHLPNFICQDCELELNLAFNFRLKCEEADAELRELCQIEQVIEFDEIAEYEIPHNFEHNEENEIKKEIRIEFEILREPIDITFENIITDDNNLKYETASSINNLKYETACSIENINDDVKCPKDETSSNIVIDAISANEINDKAKEKLEDKSKEIGPFVCEICQFTTDLYNNYRLHIKSHDDKRFQCEICTNWFKSKCMLKSHLNTTHNKHLNYYTCNQCGKSLSSRRSLQRHISNHNEHYLSRQHHECTICGQNFTRNDNLRRHLKAFHTDVRNYICEVDNCNRIFKSMNGINNHKLKVHNLSNNEMVKKYKKVECPQCKKLFYSNAVLKIHMRSHTGEKPFLCYECGKCFSTQSGLNGHILIHKNLKPHKCDICNESFRQYRHLQLHRRIHTGEQNNCNKPYLCTECGKSFALRSTFIIHSLIHKNIKPHKCDICNISFRQYPHLQRHRTTHTGEKKYKCDLCNKELAYKGNLREHMKIHLGTAKKRIRKKKITVGDSDIIIK